MAKRIFELVCAAVLVAGVFSSAAEDEMSVKVLYVFGDSLVDVGNNDDLPKEAPKANYPYGMDLPGKPTGRFTNGYNLADIVAQRLGFEMSPQAYRSMWWFERDDVRRCNIGANYASGGSGILDTTGQADKVLTMRTQIQYFKRDTDNMKCYYPVHKKDHLSESLFLLSAGGNDLSAFNGSMGDGPAYVEKMATTYVEHIQVLYDLGARMVGILDVPPVGCTPGIRANMSNGECNEGANSLAKGFNNLLRVYLAKAATTNMKGLKYSIASNYNILSDMIANPFIAGFKEVQKACCGGGRFRAERMCSHADTTACTDNHDDYLFWDMLHGTQATYERGVVAFFYGDAPKYAEPINFSTLVKKKTSLVAPKIQMVADE